MCKIKKPQFAWHLVAVAVLIATGCAPARQLDVDSLAGIERIGIVNVLGNDLEASYIGFTLFNNDYYVVSDLNWMLRDRATEVLENRIQEAGYEIVRLEYDYASMYEKYSEKRGTYGAGLAAAYNLDNAVPIFENELMQLRDEVDAFLLIVPAYRTIHCEVNPCEGYGRFGFGLYKRGEKGIAAYIAIKVIFVAADPLKREARFIADRHVEIGPVEWESDFTQYNETEKEKIHTGIVQAMNEGLGTALEVMGIVGSGK